MVAPRDDDDDDKNTECPSCHEDSYNPEDGCGNGCDPEEIGWSRGFNDGDD